ncbi:MAG: hypothetical protein B7Y45_13595 [Sphingomonas sp. 28-66-16]|nr:MAG: hypothetical protein B7Y45_13595 [Sphingomonas sp. 28-66-16]
MTLMSIQDFAGAANETFELSVGEAAMPLTLIEVKPLPTKPVAGMLRAPFSLLFKSESPVILPQRIYRVKNAAMGALDVFLVPVARDGPAVVYQAVFN